MDLFIEATPCYLNIFLEDIAEICREYIQERLKASYGGLSSVSLIGLPYTEKRMILYKVLTNVPAYHVRHCIEESWVLSAWDLRLSINFRMTESYRGIWVSNMAKVSVRMVP